MEVKYNRLLLQFSKMLYNQKRSILFIHMLFVDQFHFKKKTSFKVFREEIKQVEATCLESSGHDQSLNIFSMGVSVKNKVWVWSCRSCCQQFRHYLYSVYHCMLCSMELINLNIIQEPGPLIMVAPRGNFSQDKMF